MYLHIGKDKILNSKDIIGIFDISSMQETQEYKLLYNSLSNDIINLANEEKTFILTTENKKLKAYISNISSLTIGKRNN